jgi:KamA family protein
MIRNHRIAPRKYRAYTRSDIDSISQLRQLSTEELLQMKAVSAVLPFRVNEYVLSELIDWGAVPFDPLFQLTFPQPGMLADRDRRRMEKLIRKNAPEAKIRAEARRIQLKLNPHPAGQMELNVPRLNGQPIRGLQHKYRETVLVFPSQGQTCHAYCTYCFRWAQFVGIDDLKFASREADAMVRYLKEHHEVQSVLFTGGDPLVMRSTVLRRYIEPLLAPELDHLVSIRIGTKATAYWPYRFLTDPDADDLMRLFSQVRKAGRDLAIMSHYSHPRELETPVAQLAVRRIRAAGATLRCQAPLVRHVNDSATIWADLWRIQVALGAIPYYMFVERDTGPKNYFEVPLVEAYEIFTMAYRHTSGLARTVRGPTMSATPGKVMIESITELNGERVFVLKFLQAREPSWVNRVFLAKYNPRATWLTDLRPAFGQKQFFFREAMDEIKRTRRQPAWGQHVTLRKPVTVFGHVEWE